MYFHTLLSFFLNKSGPSEGLCKSKGEQVMRNCFSEADALALALASALGSLLLPG